MRVRLPLLVVSLVIVFIISLVSCQLSGDLDADRGQWIEAPRRGRSGKRQQRVTQPPSRVVQGPRKRPQRKDNRKTATVANPAPAGANRTPTPNLPRAGEQYSRGAGQQAAHDLEDEARQVALSSATFTLDKFVKLASLGRGASGTVFLARHVDLGKYLFAIKEINKPANYQSTTGRKAIQQLTSELNLAQAKSPFVATLFAALQDPQKVYLVQEYAPGGTLHDLLVNRPQFHLDLEQARFYIAEVILGVQDIHERGIMHRDLKPKNILVGSDGHLLLIDFGLSKQVERTSTRCGTLNYMAPEVVSATSKSPYKKAADLFSLGVLLYEMVTGVTPFKGPNPRITYRNIMYNYPDFSQLPVDEDTDDDRHLRSLLLGLLEKEPEKRFTLEQAMAHPFFATLDWDNVRSKAHGPPLARPPDTVSRMPPGEQSSYASNPSATGYSVEPDDPFSGFDQVFRDQLHI